MLMLAYEGGGGGHRLAYISKFNKGYFRLFQIFVHILSPFKQLEDEMIEISFDKIFTL